MAYSVISASQGWMVEYDSKRQGPYQSHDTALRVAVAEALAFRRKGKPVRISALNRDGSVCAEYCLCADFKIA
jgi:hypothetical protein